MDTPETRKDNCWTTGDESEDIDVITYQYPENATCTPFSRNSQYNHFINASGFTYLGHYDDFKDPYRNEKVQKAIPMGYKSILIYERVCLYNNGELIFDRDVPKNGDKSDKYAGKYVVFINQSQYYRIPSWKTRELVTYEIKPNVFDKLQVDAEGDLNTAKKTAIDYSRRYKAKCIVCMILEYVYWH